MSNTVAVVCARCGESLPPAAEQCSVCNGAVAHSVLTPPSIDPLTTAPGADASRRALSVLLSIAVAVLVGGVVVLVAIGWGAASALLAGLGVVIVVGFAQFAAWVRTGRTVGNLITGTRTVHADDGTAPSWRVFASPAKPAPARAGQGAFGRSLGLVTVVVDARRDPLALSGRSIAQLPARMGGGRLRAPSAVVLTFDGRVRIPLVRTTILGRNPPAAGADTTVVALPDLSRSISKSHVRLDRDGERVFATDLGSTNGTQLVVDGVVRDLRGGERVEVPSGAHLLLAGFALRVDSGQQGAAA